MKRLCTLQCRSERTDDSDLESIEDPSNPKPDNYENVKTAQRQSVEAERDVCVNDGGRKGGLLHLRCFHSRAPTEMLSDTIERADEVTRPSRSSSGVNSLQTEGRAERGKSQTRTGFSVPCAGSRISNLFDDALQSLTGESKCGSAP
jgi:hypothetical protein